MWHVHSRLQLPSDVIQGTSLWDMEFFYVMRMGYGISLYQDVKVNQTLHCLHFAKSTYFKYYFKSCNKLSCTYVLYNHEICIVLQSATWIVNTHNCIFPEYCENPTPVNGSVNAAKSPITSGYYYVGTDVSFSCDSGYNLIGSVSSTCQTNGSWNPSPPKCKQGNETDNVFYAKQ